MVIPNFRECVAKLIRILREDSRRRGALRRTQIQTAAQSRAEIEHIVERNAKIRARRGGELIVIPAREIRAGLIDHRRADRPRPPKCCHRIRRYLRQIVDGAVTPLKIISMREVKASKKLIDTMMKVEP